MDAPPRSYSGPIVWDAVATEELYYSSNWQVLEDTKNFNTGTIKTVDQYVWRQVSIDPDKGLGMSWHVKTAYKAAPDRCRIISPHPTAEGTGRLVSQ
jgi:hypothetical protein